MLCFIGVIMILPTSVLAASVIFHEAMTHVYLDHTRERRVSLRSWWVCVAFFPLRPGISNGKPLLYSRAPLHRNGLPVFLCLFVPVATFITGCASIVPSCQLCRVRSLVGPSTVPKLVPHGRDNASLILRWWCPAERDVVFWSSCRL